MSCQYCAFVNPYVHYAIYKDKYLYVFRVEEYNKKKHELMTAKVCVITIIVF